jgi:anti-sigma regulatory factor (Ser/Thr protein kinase)
MQNSITQLSDESFEAFLSHVNASDVIDLSQVTFIDPYGMVGVLEAGRMFSLQGIEKTLLLPGSDNVLKYLERMDFFKFAAKFFNIEHAGDDLSDRYTRSSYSDVLLEITPIEKSDDIHFIVGKVKERAHTILAKHLHYDEGAINGFIVALSEVCQNIVEHSENTGFVGIQKYRFQKLEKNVVKIAVMDLGIGFKRSLEERFHIKDDLEAVDKALFHAVSRYADEGRGHGLAAVRRFTNKWNGKLSIRSGSAKLAVVPEWSWGKKRETNLTYFPGAQINIMLPEI